MKYEQMANQRGHGDEQLIRKEHCQWEILNNYYTPMLYDDDHIEDNSEIPEGNVVEAASESHGAE